MRDRDFVPFLEDRILRIVPSEIKPPLWMKFALFLVFWQHYSDILRFLVNLFFLFIHVKLIKMTLFRENTDRQQYQAISAQCFDGRACTRPPPGESARGKNCGQARGGGGELYIHNRYRYFKVPSYNVSVISIAIDYIVVVWFWLVKKYLRFADRVADRVTDSFSFKNQKYSNTKKVKHCELSWQTQNFTYLKESIFLPSCHRMLFSMAIFIHLHTILCWFITII